MPDQSTPPVRVRQLPLGPLQTNCYILACSDTSEAVVIDPSWDGRAIANAVDERGWRLSGVWLTHAHFDHVGGLADLQRLAPTVPVAIHPDALPMLRLAHQSALMWDLAIESPEDPDVMLSDGQILQVGNQEVAVLYTPGHAPGHVCFYLAESNLLFDGDVLFQRSIGRTDLPGGDYPTLMKSIREKLLVLPNETVVLSGHGPMTTIGAERQSNPFLRD